MKIFLHQINYMHLWTKDKKFLSSKIHFYSNYLHTYVFFKNKRFLLDEIFQNLSYVFFKISCFFNVYLGMYMDFHIAKNSKFWNTMAISSNLLQISVCSIILPENINMVLCTFFRETKKYITIYYNLPTYDEISVNHNKL